MALSATVRFKKSSLLECHRYYYPILKTQFTNTSLLRDSIIIGLSRYLKVLRRYFSPLKVFILGIGRDRTENVLWRAKNLLIPPLLKNMFVLCETNNLFIDSLMEIGDCIIKIGPSWKIQQYQRFYFRLIPTEKNWSVCRVLIKDVNRILK